MKFQKTTDKGTSLSEINIIPLVDIMLVLLIIFMVTAPMLQEGIDVDLPEVSAGAVDINEKDLVMSIDHDGKIFLGDDNQNKFSLVSIESRLKEVFASRPEKVLYLKADQNVRYGYVVEVMAACRRSGIEKIGMVTQTPEDEEAASGKTAMR